MQFCNRRIVKPLADRLCRNAAHNGVGRHILCYYGTGTDNSSITDGHTGENERFIAYSNIVTDDNITLVVPCASDVFYIEPLFLKENRKRVSRHRLHRMIGTGKEKFCTAGN